MHPDFDRRGLVIHDATSCDGRDFWHYLQDAGLTCAVVDVPGTYPPGNMSKGVIIANCTHGVAAGAGFTYPPEYEFRLKAKVGYRT